MQQPSLTAVPNWMAFFLAVSPLYGSAISWSHRVTTGKPLGDVYSLGVFRIIPAQVSLIRTQSHDHISQQGVLGNASHIHTYMKSDIVVGYPV